MIRGIIFEIPNRIGTTLYDMLSPLGIDSLNWYVEESQSEVLDGQSQEDFFTKCSYSGAEFEKLIQTEHYLIFLKLYGYQGNSFDIVHSYEEFRRSNCRLLILINDCEFVEVYATYPEDIIKLQECVEKNKYHLIRYITDENDKRVKLDVL